MLTKEELKNNLSQIIGPKHRHPYDEKAKSHMEIVESILVEYFKSFDWNVELQNVKFDEFTTKWGVSHKNLDGNNIICTKHFDNSKETMIIAAHHDTVPLSPGADDNGSGLILLMAIAKYYEVTKSEYNIMLISFDFEEIGLVGSEFFAANIRNYFPDTSKIKGVIVLETLGYYSQEQFLPKGFDILYRKEISKLKQDKIIKGDFLTVIYNGRSKHIMSKFKETNTDLKIGYIRDPIDKPIIGKLLNKIIPSLKNLLRSDHTPFWLRDLPAVMLTDTANFRNPNYHQPSDLEDTLDYDKLLEIYELVINLNYS